MEGLRRTLLNLMEKARISYENLARVYSRRADELEREMVTSVDGLLLRELQ